MKTLLLAAAAACLPLCAAAKDRPHKQVVVTAPSTAMSQWVGQVSRQLSANLEYPLQVGAGTPEQGRAAITFQRGDDGRPTSLALVRSTGSSRLNRAAVRAVERLAMTDPMPDGIAPDQQFRANVIFGLTPEDVVAQTRAMNRETARARLAEAGQANAIALSAVAAY